MVAAPRIETFRSASTIGSKAMVVAIAEAAVLQATGKLGAGLPEVVTNAR